MPLNDIRDFYLITKLLLSWYKGFVNVYPI